MILKPHAPAIIEEKRDSEELLALISRAAKGDEAAFSTLVERYEKMVFNLAYQYTQNREDAADVSQEVFLKLWRSLPTFRGESSFATWIFRITRNSALDLLRKRTGSAALSLTVEDEDGEEGSRERDLIDPAVEHDPAAAAERKERTHAVHAAIASLRADHREILVLREMRGFSYNEIADMLGLELGTVKSRINRARMQVKEFLESRNIF